MVRFTYWTPSQKIHNKAEYLERRFCDKQAADLNFAE